MSFHPDTLKDLTGKVYIVTGGNSGIGYFTAAHLAEHGAHVYLCARSATKGEEAIAKIKVLYPHAKLTHLQIDHMSLSSVVAAAELFLSKENALHGLVNNAGIMATPFEITKDGHEAQWQTNYLAHWVFTSHLIPLMLETSKRLPEGSVRIVNLTSSGHWGAPSGGIKFDDPSVTNGSPSDRYGQSKLANVLHTKTLHKRYGPGSPSASAGKGEIWVSCVHPGLVQTNIGANSQFPLFITPIFRALLALGFFFDSDRGSWTSLFCVASENMKKKQSGCYFQRIAEAGWQSGSAKDPKLAEKLEDWTEVLMKKEGWVN